MQAATLLPYLTNIKWVRTVETWELNGLVKTVGFMSIVVGLKLLIEIGLLRKMIEDLRKHTSQLVDIIRTSLMESRLEKNASALQKLDTVRLLQDTLAMYLTNLVVPLSGTQLKNSVLMTQKLKSC